MTSGPKKKKALMLAVCHPDAVGGQAACARMLLNNLDIVEWTAISFPLPRQYNAPMRILASVIILLKSLMICITKKIDVVHILTACGRSALFEKLVIGRVLKLTGVKVVINFQGAFDNFYTTFSSGDKRFVRNALNKLDRILCLHDDMRNFLVENRIVDSDKIIVIPNAVPIGIPLQKMADGNGKIRLTYLGWIVTNKGLHTLLKAVSVLVNRHGMKNFSLTIAGPGIEPDLIQKLTDEAEDGNVSSFIRFYDPVYGDDKIKFFAATDIFVFPTRMEGFPFVLLEAMEAGLPVVTTNISPMNRIVQEGVSGMLFRLDDAEDLAKQIAALIQDEPLRARLGAAAREQVKANYSIEKIIGQYEGLYRSL